MGNRSLVIIKPDAVRRGLADEIIEVLTENGFVIDKKEERVLTKDTLLIHYSNLDNRPRIKEEVIEFMASGPSIVMSVSHKDETVDVVSKLRVLVGATNPLDAMPGTIRARFGTSTGFNAIHASDSVNSSIAEHNLHFPDRVVM